VRPVSLVRPAGPAALNRPHNPDQHQGKSGAVQHRIRDGRARPFPENDPDDGCGQADQATAVQVDNSVKQQLFRERVYRGR
jgi:hypothetical protein